MSQTTLGDPLEYPVVRIEERIVAWQNMAMKFWQFVYLICGYIGSISLASSAQWKQTGAGLHHHPDIRIAPWAVEPMVVDPVALCFRENGDAYVVEMRDYPYGFGPDRRGGGTIRILRDLDGDDQADFSALFAGELSFPTSITPWKEGVLVGAPPEILYLADTDGDDRADVRQVLVRGFDLGVTDSNMNSLQFAYDNTIHGANGGAGGQLSVDGPHQGRLDLNDADFAWDPILNTINRTCQTGGGFGLVFNRSGDSFTTYNIDYLQQQIIPLRYLKDASGLKQSQLTRNISIHGAMARIYPVSRQETRVNHPEQAGHFSSAGGMGILDVEYFGPRSASSIFVCDVVGNLVHRDKLWRDGPVWKAGRANEELDREFIASEDLAFRPVGMTFGPDGAMYLLDMQRAVIEHPDYIPAKVLKNMDYREGEDRGRIYRITPSNPSKLPPRVNFSLVPQSGWATVLESPNPWARSTAQRLIVSQQAEGLKPRLLATATSSARTDSRISALWSLAGLGQINPEQLTEFLQSPTPDIRLHALKIVEKHFLDQMPLGEALLEDKEAYVRFQAALSFSRAEESVNLDAGMLSRMWIKDGRHPDHQMALRILIADQADDVMMSLLESVTGDAAMENDILIFSAPLIDQASRLTSGPELIRLLLGAVGRMKNSQSAVDPLEALVNGLKHNPHIHELGPLISRDLDVWFQNAREPHWSSILELAALSPSNASSPGLEKFRKRIRDVATDLMEDEDRRARAIQALGSIPGRETASLVGEILITASSEIIQNASLKSLEKLKDDRTGTWIVKAWTSLAPSLRTGSIQLLLSRNAYRIALLDGLEHGTIAVSELNLDLEQRRTLLRWSPLSIQNRASKYFSDEEYSNRKVIVDDWLARLPENGSAQNGQKIFLERCATCHVVGALGQSIGPELTGVYHRSDEDLISHILDPNMAINPNYVTCVAETKDGDLLTGLLMSQSASRIEMKTLSGEILLLPEESLASFRIEKRSLMPEGLEAGLSPGDLKSLVLFLQTSR